MPAETHRRHGAPDRAEVEQVVEDALAEIAGVSGPVDAELGLRDAAGLDDLTLLHVVEEIEHALGDRTVALTIDDEELAEVRTVRDLVDTIVAHLETRSARTESAP